MSFDDIIGRKNKENILCWYNNGKPKRKILILQGRSGNGKTTTIIEMAKSLCVELQIVTPDYEDRSNVLKAVNTSLSPFKLILVDDFDSFNANKKKILYEIIDISQFPIVVTCREWKFRGDIFGKAQYFRFSRPSSNEIYELLTEKTDISPKKAEKIAKNANSVMEALQSAVTGFIPSYSRVALSNNDKLKMMKERNACESIEKPNINFYFWAIRGYTNDAINTMIEFSYYDYICHQRFEKIEPWVLNRMTQKIENVTLISRPPKKKKEKQKKKSEQKEDKKETPVDSLDSWL